MPKNQINYGGHGQNLNANLPANLIDTFQTPEARKQVLKVLKKAKAKAKAKAKMREALYQAMVKTKTNSTRKPLSPNKPKSPKSLNVKLRGYGQGNYR